MSELSPELLEEYNQLKSEARAQVDEVVRICTTILKSIDFGNSGGRLSKLAKDYITQLLSDPLTILALPDEDYFEKFSELLETTILAEPTLGEKFIDNLDYDDLDTLINTYPPTPNNSQEFIERYIREFAGVPDLPKEVAMALLVASIRDWGWSNIRKIYDKIPYLNFDEAIKSNSYRAWYRHALLPKEIPSIQKFRIILANDDKNIILAKFYFLSIVPQLCSGIPYRVLHSKPILDSIYRLIKEIMSVDKIEVDVSLLDFSDLVKRLDTFTGGDIISGKLRDFIKMVHDPDFIPLLDPLSPVFRLLDDPYSEQNSKPNVRLEMYKFLRLVLKYAHDNGEINIPDKYLRSLSYFDDYPDYQQAIVDLSLAHRDSVKFDELRNGIYRTILLAQQLGFEPDIHINIFGPGAA